jgi:predicted phosphodiesterase
VRIGLISDIHGNLPALDATLAQLAGERIDRLICLGDIAPGPWASETVKRLAPLAPDCILGNWDAWILHGEMPCGDNPTGHKLLEMAEFWTADLDDDDRTFMRRAHRRLEIDCGDGERLVFFHGSPRSYNEPILSATPTEELRHMFRTCDDAPVVFVGHTHVQMIRRLPFTLLVNPGSVGLPFVEWPVSDAHVLPWAEFGIVEFHADGELDVELRRTPYDARALVEHVLESGVPHAKWWTDCFVDARPARRAAPAGSAAPAASAAPGSP